MCWLQWVVQTATGRSPQVGQASSGSPEASWGPRGTSWLAAGLVPANYCPRPSSPTRPAAQFVARITGKQQLGRTGCTSIARGGVRRSGGVGGWFREDELSRAEGRQAENQTHSLTTKIAWMQFSKWHSSKKTFTDEKKLFCHFFKILTQPFSQLMTFILVPTTTTKSCIKVQDNSFCCGSPKSECVVCSRWAKLTVTVTATFNHWTVPVTSRGAEGSLLFG